LINESLLFVLPESEETNGETGGGTGVGTTGQGLGGGGGRPLHVHLVHFPDLHWASISQY
tara:strand:+ start:180 stop:359 length:180 start_codon:yes stop_codon:yes gene_type:complete